MPSSTTGISGFASISTMNIPAVNWKFQFLSCIVHVFVSTTSSRLQIKYILLTLEMVIVITPMFCKTEPQKKLPRAHFLCLQRQMNPV
jgi:hypothetical protein